MNSTVALTLMLLSLMVGAGVVSASWGYALGREALKGVTQPDVRPNATLGKSDAATAHSAETVTILKEQDIITQVKARRDGKPSASPVSSETVNPSPSVAPSASPSPAAALNLPVTGQHKGVKMEVQAVRREEDVLVLEVALTNDGDRPTQFLYSFLNVTDSNGRMLSANTDGLPTELPANGEPFFGRISIPTALLEGPTALTLSLSDYPDQEIQLKVSDVPVPQ